MFTPSPLLLLAVALPLVLVAALIEAAETGNEMQLVNLIRSKAVEAAAPGICIDKTCDCNVDLDSVGCRISSPAPDGCACLCYYSVVSCSGKVVDLPSTCTQGCRVAASGTGVAACKIGGGNCGGYYDTCDCGYDYGGCEIMRAAPAYSACSCAYHGFWTCGGSIVGCSNWGDANCISPSNNRDSCLQGGGDCDGY